MFDSIDVKSETDEHELELRTEGLSDVYVTRNAIAVVGHSGWHTHPGPSLIIVTEGWIMAYDSDDPTCIEATANVCRSLSGVIRVMFADAVGLRP